MLHRSFDDRCPLHGREAPAGLTQELGETTFSQAFDLEAFRAATLKEAANRMCMVCEGHYELTLCGGTRDKPYRPEHCMFRAAIEGVQK